MQERRFVKVREAGVGIFSVHEWHGEVVEGGLVKLKPGYNNFVFSDLRPVEKYKPVPNTAAHRRAITDITEEEYNKSPRGLL